MYRLFIANKNYSSWSLRPWVLMRALDIGFEEVMNPFVEGSNFENFRHFSPSGRVPCLHDGATVVWDSLAIAEYLAERHDGVWPEDSAARTWARCAACDMHSGFFALRNACSMSCGHRVKLASVDATLQADIDRLDELWSEGLGRFGGPWLAGQRFTAVDAFYAPVAFRAQTYDLSLSGPARAYADRLLAHPAMVEWYEAALAEPWRDEGHDMEVSAVGTILEDLRVRT